MPETVIAPHRVLSPLPKRLRTQKNAEHPKIPEEEPELPEVVVQNIKPQIKPEIGMPVFAKWVDKTLIRYWPGKIKDIEEEKFHIEYDDGLEKPLKREDFILADGMTQLAKTRKKVYFGRTIHCLPQS